MKDRFIPVLDIGLGWWKIYDRQRERTLASIYDYDDSSARDYAHRICRFLNTEDGDDQ